MFCSFCSEEASKVDHLIKGIHSVFICDRCVTACQQVIDTARIQKQIMQTLKELQLQPNGVK